MSELQAVITELENDPLLDHPTRLRQRIEALDCLESYILADQDQLGGAECDTRAGLSFRARAISARLDASNRELYQAIRREIQCGAMPDLLQQWVPPYGPDGGLTSRVSGEGYDFLDVLISGVLQFAQPGADVAELASEMVTYQPTPARHIFDLISGAALTAEDVLVDLGSGLGHVPLLVAICTRAKSIGIELEATYVDCAKRSARELHLDNVMFLQQDARAADYSSGTLFYLYTPFTGTILRDVLDALRREAARREIRICTYGPCTPTVAEEDWLESIEVPQTDRITVFHSRHSILSFTATHADHIGHITP